MFCVTACRAWLCASWRQPVPQKTPSIIYCRACSNLRHLEGYCPSKINLYWMNLSPSIGWMDNLNHKRACLKLSSFRWEIIEHLISKWGCKNLNWCLIIIIRLMRTKMLWGFPTYWAKKRLGTKVFCLNASKINKELPFRHRSSTAIRI